MKGLYAIVDADTLAQRGIDVVAFTGRVLAARPCALQLRAKRATPAGTLADLRALLPLCRAAGVPLFGNDRPDLAMIAGCDGVHVGQDDLRVDEVRRFAPKLRVGVSTHDHGQLDRALSAKPDYVAFGPVFLTRSKDEPDPVVGLGALEKASASCRRAKVPLVAIGGITLERAPKVASLADAAAVIGALVPGADEDLEVVTAKAVALGEAFGAAS